PDQLRSLIEDIRQALDELKKMADVLEAKCQDGGTSYAPSTTALRSVLQECLDCAESFLRQLVPSAGEQPSADSGQAGAGETTTAGSATSGAAAPTGPLRSREDAFRLLLQVADYFRRSEPHSPLSYSLEQAVRWGRQPLPDLLRELISDDAVRAE